MATAIDLFLSLEPGAHVIVLKVMYWSFRVSLFTGAHGLGLQVEVVDASRLEALAATPHPSATCFVWLETSANPLWPIIGIACVATLARKSGTRAADFVPHAATKYLKSLPCSCRHVHARPRRRSLDRRLPYPYGARPDSRPEGNVPLDPRHAYARPASAPSPFCTRISQRVQVTPLLHARCGVALALCSRSAIVRASLLPSPPAQGTRLWKGATSFSGVESLIEYRAPVEGSNSPWPPDLLGLPSRSKTSRTSTRTSTPLRPP